MCRFMKDLVVDSYEKLRYDEEELKLLLNCLNDPKVAREEAKYLIVGDENLLSYIDYFNCLKKYFDLGCNVVEFGCGSFPIMSYFIDSEQKKLGTGSVSAYDIRLNKVGLGNIVIKPSLIKMGTDLGRYDLMVGIYPCHSSELFIRKANQDRVNFFLTMCDCPPYNGDYNELLKVAMETVCGDSEIMVDTSFKNHPVLIKRKVEKIEDK